MIPGWVPSPADRKVKGLETAHAHYLRVTGTDSHLRSEGMKGSYWLLPLFILGSITFFVNLYYYLPSRVHHYRITPIDRDATPKKPARHLDMAKEPEVGYVMASNYSDQMTGSAANVVSLQCWASTLGTDVRVVEPFVRHSLLGVNLYAASNASAPETENNSVRLRDVFDIKEWERKTNSMAPIVTWDHFINHSKRKLILVDRECPNKKCMDCDQQFINSSKEFADRFHFTIVRRVCFPRRVLNESDFKKLVYADNSLRGVTVIFNSWGGVAAHGDLEFRVGISGHLVNKCQRSGCFRYNPVSQKIVDDAQCTSKNTCLLPSI